jgi:hypothetical protein
VRGIAKEALSFRAVIPAQAGIQSRSGPVFAVAFKARIGAITAAWSLLDSGLRRNDECED